MNDPIALTTPQQLQLELMSRAIDSTEDPEALRRTCKQLLHAWQVQKVFTEAAMNIALWKELPRNTS